jgi:16S rRNA (guanine(966)-N(2))-methyltransferase RsmD
MHIIAGHLKGRRLEYVSTPELRPASQKVRSAVFNILQERIVGARVLDLFCGTGSVGLEALSRGAAHVDFVDHDVTLVVRNVKHLDVSAEVNIYRKDALRAVQTIVSSTKSYDLVYVGAPYDYQETPAVLEAVGTGGVVAAGGCLMVEHRNRTHPLDRHGGLVLARRYSYGQTILSVYKP